MGRIHFWLDFDSTVADVGVATELRLESQYGISIETAMENNPHLVRRLRDDAITYALARPTPGVELITTMLSKREQLGGYIHQLELDQPDIVEAWLTSEAMPLAPIRNVKKYGTGSKWSVLENMVADTVSPGDTVILVDDDFEEIVAANEWLWDATDKELGLKYIGVLYGRGHLLWQTCKYQIDDWFDLVTLANKEGWFEGGAE